MSRIPPTSTPRRASRATSILLLLAFTCLPAGTKAPAAAPQSAIIGFRPHVDFATATQPFTVKIGDLNGDGKPDLVVANISSSMLSVLLGNGVGGFGPKSDRATGNGPIYLAIGDLNGDGKPDLAVTNYYASTVSVLLGNGDGTFGVQHDFPTGGLPWGVAIGDLNGDGKPDMVVCEEQRGTLSVFFGDGLGGFGAPTILAVGISPIAVEIRDLNGDGKPDLAVAVYGSNTISVRLGNGDGTFGAQSDYGTGNSPESVAIGDLNGDGKLDLAVSNGASSTLSVLLGNGDGTFSAKQDYATGTYPRVVAIGDLNGDAKPDVAVVNYVSNTVSVFPGRGDGSFDPRNDFVTGANPASVAIKDLNGDGAPDLAVTNQGSNSVSVLFNASEFATLTSLSSSPNPTVFGQAVSLTASVVPNAATGTVQFLEGTNSIGTASLAAGTATLTVASLAIGTRSLTAVYNGDGTYVGSRSLVLIQTVNPASSTTSLSSSVNPSIFKQAVSFTAVVSVSPPGGGTPAGTVQFRIDNADFGAPVALVGGSATSTGATTLAVGTHSVEAVYGGNASFLGSSSPVLTQTVEFSNPAIVAVRDVPNDQGGHVFITWRTPQDKPGVQVVTGYRVWRRAPNPSAPAAARATLGVPVATNGAAAERGRRVALPDGTLLEGFWEAIATLPAEQLINYAYEAPTTQDSMAESNPYTAYFVTALTPEPFVFFASAIDSGYSVDNLAPPAPAPFVATYSLTSTARHWAESPAGDFREFRLYRGLTAQFVPGSANLVVATRDTGFVDVARTFYFYKLSAADIHGNQSLYALVTPDGPVATLASLASVDAQPDRIRLTWYSAGNVGLRATVYRRTGDGDWAALGVIMPDGTGYLRYEDRAVTIGTRYGYRLGIMDGGIEVFVGEAWATAERLVFALEGARPNPGAASDLTVLFSLPSADPARLELLDIAGRRVAQREVGSLGPGRHAVNLAQGGRIPPGIYLVRLTQRPNVRVMRAAILN